MENPEEKAMPSILQELTQLYGDVMDVGKKGWVWLVLYPLLLVLLSILIGLGLNVAGLKGANIFFAVVMTLVFGLSALRPEFIINLLALSIFSGLLRTPHTIDGEVRKFFGLYLTISKNMLLYLLLVFLTLGTFEFSGKAWVFWTVAMLSLFLILASDIWKIGGKIAVRLIYASGCILVVICLLNLVPLATWHKLGWDPLSYFRNSPVESAVADERAEAEARAEEALAEAYKKAKDKEKKGRELTREEKEIIRKAEKRADDNTLPVKVRQLLPGKEEKKPEKITQLEVLYPDGNWRHYRVLELRTGQEIHLVASTTAGKVLYRGTLQGGKYIGKWTDLSANKERGVFELQRSDKEGALFLGWHDDIQNKKGGKFETRITSSFH